MFLDQLHVKSSCFIFIYFVIYFFLREGGVSHVLLLHTLYLDIVRAVLFWYFISL